PFDVFGDIFVRTRAVDDGKSIVVQDLVLDGQSVGDASAAVGADGLDILWISGGALSDGFTLMAARLLPGPDPPRPNRGSRFR
ncbi:MAG: hypothetical protein PHD74_08550, partial [Candidatus Krumholzibacteria bacterium]|nr:hypothetical protein [Candidatus Krumholzibacteria bacterium]